MITTLLLNIERVIVLWEDRSWWEGHAGWTSLSFRPFQESKTLLSYVWGEGRASKIWHNIVLSRNVWYLVLREMQETHGYTVYSTVYTVCKFVRRMSEHHKLLPIWDWHFPKMNKTPLVQKQIVSCLKYVFQSHALSHNFPPTGPPRRQSGCSWTQDVWWSGWHTLHRPRPGRNVRRASSGRLFDPSITSYFQFGICLFLMKLHDAPFVQKQIVSCLKSVFQCRWNAFCFCLASSHPVHLWPMPCASTKPSWSWLQQQPDWRRGNLVGGCGWSVSGKLWWVLFFSFGKPP